MVCEFRAGLDPLTRQLLYQLSYVSVWRPVGTHVSKIEIPFGTFNPSGLRTHEPRP
jgi:hypothetical protein